MAIEVAKYQFQSWARKGISAQINEPDTLGNPATALPPVERATVPIGVSINAAPQPAKMFQLVGPGDVIGIHRDMVVRTEPRRWVTNFEPNYLAFVEFYDEDFPWRYTPAKPVGERLRPWIQLLVLEESEFERDDRRVPLPVVTVKRNDALPRPDDSWLFAHVHTEQEIGAGQLSSLEEYLRELQDVVTTDPDKIYSRLMSSRHLAPNRSYQAFVVPSFEAGRLAGLGRPTTTIPAQQSAWDATTASVELPFYFDWSFSTGDQADFESLVELLQPRVLDARIGIRDMDCARPGFVLVDAQGRERAPAAGAQPGLPTPAPAVQGLEGALKTSRTQSRPPTFTPNAFQTELQILVNLPETVTSPNAPAGTDEEFLDDPVVTLPFYGQNHARQHKTDQVLLDTNRDGWLHDLNRDPRTRVPAAFGTSVVQRNQERLMQRAWQQVQKVYEANRTLRQFQFLLKISTGYSTQFFTQLPPANLLAVTSPLHAKVLGSPTTIRHQVEESRLAAPVLSPTFRRMVRPTGKLARRLDLDAGSSGLATIVDEVNAGRADPAPPRAVPEAIPSVDDLAAAIRPARLPDWVAWLMRHRILALVVALVLLLLGLASSAWLLAGALGVVALAGFAWLTVQARRVDDANELIDPVRGLEALSETPARPDFAVSLASDPPGTALPAPTRGAGPGEDSVEAASFRVAATRLQSRVVLRVPDGPEREDFKLDNARTAMIKAIDPRKSFPLRLSRLVQLPHLELEEPEQIVDAMAHPDFEDAMYAYLRDISKELLIPNLHLIPPDTISLLETNPKFIESYLVGLNHEMGRELLWREYPTDMRGSYFRQFWEVKGIGNPDTPADAEQLKDITKIHAWQSATPLGAHKPPPGPRADVQPGQKQVVLVVRGELLKRYPNTVVYAQKAIDDGHGNDAIRETDLTPEQFDKELKFPLFRAEIDPDLRFFGFDLTTEKAKGDQASIDFPGDKRGWYFVLQEVPGEPRFGMDVSYTPTTNATPQTSDDPLDDWDNLAWNSFGSTEPAFVPRLPAPTFPRPNLAELAAHPWGTTSAQMAYALFQSPVMVAVHAKEMLELTDA
jgi:hypothetical protein